MTAAAHRSLVGTMDASHPQTPAVRGIAALSNRSVIAAIVPATDEERSRLGVDWVPCTESRGESCIRSVSSRAGLARAPVGCAAHVREVLVNEIDDSVTGMIHAWNAGDTSAGARLFSRVYGELRSIARSTRRRTPEHGDDTLDTTALVHEVYLRLAGANELTVQNRGHFFAVAVRAARQIVSNYARDAQALKRGGSTVVETIDGLAAQQLASPARDDDRGERISALEDALQQLEQLHPRPCRVVECRYFGGLSISDTALALGTSEATVKRDWALAQAWLHRALRAHGALDAE